MVNYSTDTKLQSSEKRICLKCGRENDLSATFCQSCGASLQQPGVRATTMPSAKMERPLGVTIIGIFQILGAIGILGLNALIAAYSPVLGLLLTSRRDRSSNRRVIVHWKELGEDSHDNRGRVGPHHHSRHPYRNNHNSLLQKAERGRILQPEKVAPRKALECFILRA